MNSIHMSATTRTALIGLVAAAAAVGGGAFVANASKHASFASSGTQDRRDGFGHFASPPTGNASAPRPGVRQDDR
jgi:hypothetical protein